MLRKHLITIISLGAFVLLGVGSSSDESKSSAGTPASSGGNSRQASKAAPVAKIYNEDEPAEAGDFKVTLIEKKYKKSVKDGFSKHKAGEGATLLLVKVKVENIGAEQRLLSDKFTVVDDATRTFETTFDCTVATKDHLNFEQINPGLSKTGWVCFEIPEASENKRLSFGPGWLDDPVLFYIDEPAAQEKAEGEGAAPVEEGEGKPKE